MIPAEFEYTRPRALKDVLSLLHERPTDCRVMAGGQSLLPLMKLRIVQPALIVDLSKIAEIRFIEIKDGGLQIGAMTPYRAVEHSKEIADACPMLIDAMKVIADPHIRNLGTIGGSLCLADPRGDMPACILALNGIMTAASVNGSRDIPAEEFFVGPFTTALKENELLTHFRIPTGKTRTGSYLKLSKRAGDFAVIAVAANIDWRNGLCSDARVALCGAGATPILVGGMTNILSGSRLEDEVIGTAARHARDITEPFEDPLVSVEYRRAMIESMVAKALNLARARLVH